ncbi:IS1595 family transposase [Pedobacter sp. KR3-3]|uniref:IS1595 family transposase n=1 Tax=Pedobacter albus TaxID=3113905 RepID=A0ABU7I462_9SPHI|nr:IS1595 family transposase [Pedobacter sp. KR3-3]MEE1944247.1 IS1595 family transposase [Pedobacter sp. KR3-3]
MLPKFNNILELVQRFPDERSCHQYLASRRWNGYMECPYEDCEGDIAYVFKDGIRYKCTCCNRVYTAKTGTFMEASKLSTLKWFIAIYLVLHKKGISSVQLAKDIGTTQKTAWFVLHRIRHAFGNEEKEKLEGVVELDESYVGGKNKNRHYNKKVKNSQGRAYKDKTPVFGMLQRDGRLVAMAISCTSARVLRPIIYSNIKQGTTLMCDEFNVYKSLETNYTRNVVEHGKGQYVNGDCYTNGLENFWSHMKRGIIGVYHKTSRTHLNRYVQEFVFKYNYRNLPVQEQMNVVFNNFACRLKYKELIK